MCKMRMRLRAHKGRRSTPYLWAYSTRRSSCSPGSTSGGHRHKSNCRSGRRPCLSAAADRAMTEHPPSIVLRRAQCVRRAALTAASTTNRRGWTAYRWHSFYSKEQLEDWHEDWLIPSSRPAHDSSRCFPVRDFLGLSLYLPNLGARENPRALTPFRVGR